MTKFLHNVNNPVLKGLQVSGRYTKKCKSYSCSKFRKSPYIYIAAAMLAGKRVPSSPFSDATYLKILRLLWPVTLFSLVQISSNLVQRHVVWYCRLYENLGQIYHNLHSHVFDDVICKPPMNTTIHHFSIV